MALLGPTTSTGRVDRLVTLDDLETWSGGPLYLFIGVDTAGSSVHRAFGSWAPHFGLEAQLRGVDLPESTDRRTSRRLVTALRDNRAVHGAVVTSHKLRLYRACSDLFDTAEPFVELTHEVSALDTRDGVHAYARDVQSLDLTLHGASAASVAAGRPLVCLGAGGAATALLLATRLDVPRTLADGRIATLAPHDVVPLTVIDRRPEPLAELLAAADRSGLGRAALDVALATTPRGGAQVLQRAAANSLIINATGLGKTGPGSPLPGPDAFPPGSAAWDFNYRGPLTFLAQARAAGVPWMDGWEYFLAGWTCALGAISGTDVVSALAEVVAASADLRATT
jgi:shikimate 5-dehydrogenase